MVGRKRRCRRVASEKAGWQISFGITRYGLSLTRDIRKPCKNRWKVLNGIFYVLSTGCQWNALPKDLPPKSTVHDYFILLDRTGALARMHEALYVAVREAAGREASPTAAIIDSQSARAASKGALRSILKASMPARKSRAASAMSLSTRSASC